MKQILLILSFFFSCHFAGAEVEDVWQQGGGVECQTIDSPALLPVQGARYLGENTSVTPAVRSVGTSRRAPASHKSPFLVIRSGKLIDRNKFHIFQEELLQFPAGIHSDGRYIYTICSLLI